MVLNPCLKDIIIIIYNGYRMSKIFVSLGNENMQRDGDQVSGHLQ